MTTLVITRGLPASGKTTWARGWVAEDPLSRVRVNRDDLRANLYDRAVLGYAGEQVVTVAQHSAVAALLKAGRSVVVDDTNLRLKHARALADLGVKSGAELQVQDFTDVPLDVCIARDAARDRVVGEQVIRGMHGKFLASGRLADVTPTTALRVEVRPYVAPEGKPSAVVVDVDGTVALNVGRSPYDPTLYHTDAPHAPVVALVRDLSDAGERIVYCSGREDTYRDATQAWLDEHVGVTGPLFMRPGGDRRNDAIVKAELFAAHIADNYRVRFVLDDRDRVVAMWRAMGLTVLQVADGAF